MNMRSDKANCHEYKKNLARPCLSCKDNTDIIEPIIETHEYTERHYREYKGPENYET